MFLADKLQRLQDEFAVLDDPHERLSAIVDRAKRIPVLAAGDRVDANRVPGCVSVVWLVSQVRDGRCVFRGDAESPIVRGLVAVLCEFFTGANVAEVAASELEPLDALKVTSNLSPTRRNGLAAVRNVIRRFAQQAVNARPENE